MAEAGDLEAISRRNCCAASNSQVLRDERIGTTRKLTVFSDTDNVAMQASGFGQLKEGYLVECSSALARRLLSKPTAAILAALGSVVHYEIAIGLNGRLWVNAQNMVTTILVANSIISSEYLTASQCQVLVQNLAAVAQKDKEGQ